MCVSITDPGMTLKHRDLTVCGRVATISESIAGVGVGSLFKTESESSAELDGSSLPPLVVEGKILVLVSFKFLIVINRYKIPCDSENRAMLPGNGARKRS